jgi:hypothetical protein
VAGNIHQMMDDITDLLGKHHKLIEAIHKREKLNQEMLVSLNSRITAIEERHKVEDAEAEVFAEAILASI